MDPKTETIDTTPSWAATARLLITILEGSSSPSVMKFARDEIVRMGEIIDGYNPNTAPTPAIVNA